MKRISFVIALLFSTPFIYAQSLQVDLALQSGVSMPLFEFAGSNLQDGSFTLPGFTGSAETILVLNGTWEGVVQAGLQLNPVDVGLLGARKVAADPFLEDLYIRSDPFRVIHLLAGPGYRKQLGKSFRIDGQVTAGVFFSSTPYQLYKSEYFQVGPPFFEITSSRDVSFAYGAGLRLVYDISPCYQVGFTNQLMHSTASFQFITNAGIRTDVRNITIWNSSLSLILKLF